MKKIIFLTITISLLSGLIFSHYVVAQKNYLNGYVLKINGDTLKGFIDFRDWSKNPDNIKFKQNQEDKITKYTPNSIRAFGVKDEIYISAIVDSEISSQQSGSLDFDPKISTEKDTTFIQLIINGQKSLYYYRNRRDNDNFYIEMNNELMLLEYKKYFKLHENDKLVKENKRFIGQLSLYLDDCQELQPKLESATYNKKDLEKIFLSYYSCVEQELTFHKKSEPAKIEFGLQAGITNTILNFSKYNNEFKYLEESDYQSSLNPTFGLYLDIIFPKNQGKWSINNELAFTSFAIEGKYEDIRSEGMQTTIYTKMAYSHLKLNNMLRYRYPIGKLFIYGNFGISNGLVISETNEKIVEEKRYSIITTSEKAALDYTKKVEQSLLAGLGIKFKKLTAEIRYEVGNGISNVVTVGSKTSRTYFQISYMF